MSDTDSFIEEVTEEVRRDRLYALGRRYGWIVALVLVLIIGGAAVNEWLKAQAEAEARGFGGALFEALEDPDVAGRLPALSTLAQADHSAALIAELAEIDSLSASDEAAAAARYETLLDSGTLDALYTDLVRLKLVTLISETAGPAARIALLDPIISVQSTFAPIALEHRAVAHLEAGDVEAAHADLRRIIEHPEVTAALRERAGQLMIATGGVVTPRASLVGQEG
ncbi:MAG: hypothetical protein AAGK98_11020 [Pseudomonadota bacterium]